MCSSTFVFSTTLLLYKLDTLLLKQKKLPVMSTYALYPILATSFCFNSTVFFTKILTVAILL